MHYALLLFLYLLVQKTHGRNVEEQHIKITPSWRKYRWKTLPEENRKTEETKQKSKFITFQNCFSISQSLVYNRDWPKKQKKTHNREQTEKHSKIIWRISTQLSVLIPAFTISKHFHIPFHKWECKYSHNRHRLTEILSRVHPWDPILFAKRPIYDDMSG